MLIPSDPRYKYATHMALATFTYLNVLNFPIDIKSLIKSEGIKLKKYSVLAKKLNISVEDVSTEYQTDLAYIFRDSQGRYAIAYNDTKPEYVIRFSLAHELGHYALLHLEDFDETILRYRGSSLTQEKYNVLEKEANCFARNLISPAPIADIVPQDMYRTYFGIGPKAEETRKNLLQTDKYYTHVLRNDIDRKLFAKIRRRLTYTHKCKNCDSLFAKKTIAFCPFCGKSNPEKLTISQTIQSYLRGNSMKYSAIRLNEQKFPYLCPRCENEHLHQEHKFCQVCGTYLRNICLGLNPPDSSDPHRNLSLNHENLGCGTELPGFARNCSDCGGVSSYYYQNLLSYWQDEKEVKDIFDDDLPF